MIEIDETKPDILEDNALNIFSEIDLVSIETPTASLKMPLSDWKRILKKLRK